MSEEPLVEEPATEEQPAKPVAAVFEGDVITLMEGKLPAITFEMPEGYERNTVLRMEIEVRVKSVRYEELRKDFARQHMLELESIALKAAYQPHEAADSVGGSASAHPEQTPEGAEELGGVEFGRTSNLWGKDTLAHEQEAGF